MKLIKGLCITGIILVIYYAYPESSLPKNKKIDFIQVVKSKKTMAVYSNDSFLKFYKIAIGSNEEGKKEFEGDKKTPVGIYYINDKNPNSSCYKNLGVSYPNDIDKINAKKLNKPSGGNIKIHGINNKFGFIGKFHRFFWTNGCIRVTNSEMEELYNSVKIGAKIQILD